MLCTTVTVLHEKWVTPVQSCRTSRSLCANSHPSLILKRHGQRTSVFPTPLVPMRSWETLLPPESTAFCKIMHRSSCILLSEGRTGVEDAAQQRSSTTHILTCSSRATACRLLRWLLWGCTVMPGDGFKGWRTAPPSGICLDISMIWLVSRAGLKTR